MNQKTQPSPEELIDFGHKEYNGMVYYLVRVDKRSDDRDLALNEGDIYKFYRATQSLLLNCEPRFIDKGIDDKDENYKKIKEGIKDIGKKLQSGAILNDADFNKNKLVYQDQLIELNTEIEKLKFKAGMIYPEKKHKELEEVYGDDY